MMMDRSSITENAIITLLLFSAVLLKAVFSDDSSTIRESKCDSSLFHKPYVTLRSSKHGPELGKLETQGIIDLREKIKVFVCINGPVIIYSDVVVEEDSSNAPGTLSHVANIRPGETIRFFNGTFKVYSHQCMTVNRIPRFALNKMEAAGITPSIDSSVPVNGLKVSGIFLITTEESFDPANAKMAKVMFNQIAFSYEIGSAENLISDASFIAVGKGPYCLTLPDGSKVVLTSEATSDKAICRWTLGENESPNKDYTRAFQKRHNKVDYKWEECPPDILTTNSSASGGSSSLLDNSNISPFAMTNPGDLDDRASNYSCSMKPGDPTCDQEAEFPVLKADPDGDDDPAQNVTPKNQFIQLKDCLLLPDFNPLNPECTSGGDLSCGNLIAALELDPDTSKGDTAPLTLESIPQLKWKYEVLSLTATIFSKTCLPIRKQSVFNVARALSSYIATAHTATPDTAEYSHLVNKSDTWKILISSLKRCNESSLTAEMEWEWSGNVEPGHTVPTALESGKQRRKKREIDTFSDVNDFYEEIVLSDNDRKLIIERSPPVFQFDSKDPSRREFMYGTIPRWKRQPIDKVPLPYIQEYLIPPEMDEGQAIYDSFMFHPDPKHLRVKDFSDKQIFYYEEAVELDADLNPIIDVWWKIWATVIGYCQINEKSREIAVYPLLFHNFDEYFLNLIKDQWKIGTVESDLVLGEFLDVDKSRWLDTCLETAYIVSDTIHLRPVRPLNLGGGSAGGEANHFVETPDSLENSDGSNAYFTRKKSNI